MNANWDYSKKSSDDGSGTVNQTYSTSVSHKAALTELIDVGGAMRYSKRYAEHSDRDIFSSSLNLNNENDLYYLGLLVHTPRLTVIQQSLMAGTGEAGLTVDGLKGYGQHFHLIIWRMGEKEIF